MYVFGVYQSTQNKTTQAHEAHTQPHTKGQDTCLNIIYIFQLKYKRIRLDLVFFRVYNKKKKTKDQTEAAMLSCFFNTCLAVGNIWHHSATHL